MSLYAFIRFCFAVLGKCLAAILKICQLAANGAAFFGYKKAFASGYFTKMPANKGAVITGSRELGKLIVLKETPYPELEDDMFILKTMAFAVNPTDYKHIRPESFVSIIMTSFFRNFGLGIGVLGRPWAAVGGHLGNFLGKGLTRFQKGKVSGSDVSGIVEEVGSKVTRVKKGDIVSVSLHGGISKNGGFSDYVKVSEIPVIKFSPDAFSQEPLSIGDHPGSKINSFETAASVGLGLETVALGLHHHLKIPTDREKTKGEYVLIWGGATATGILAIQVAKLVYGIKVITTASTKHHEYLKKLGADLTFDYKDTDVVDQLKNAGQGKIRYALDCVSLPHTLQSVYDALEGSENAAINNLLFLTHKDIILKSSRQKVPISSTNAYLTDKRTHVGMKASEEYLSDFLDFWDNHLPPVLDKIETAPLHVLPPGIGSINTGLSLLVENKISGRKIVLRNNA